MRLSTRIAGGEVAETRRFVFIPEEWERSDRNAQTIASIIGGGTLLLGVVMVVAGMILSIVPWSRRQFSAPLFLTMLATLLILSAGRLANNFPILMAQLSTAQPLRLQLAVLLGSTTVGVALQAAAH